MGQSPICFALDTDPDNARRLTCLLHPYVGAFKVGPSLLLDLMRTSETIPLPPLSILDLKFHDIPETVANSVKAAGDVGFKFATIHIQQQATLVAAQKAAEPYKMTLLGVTVLSSMALEDFPLLGISDRSILGRVARLADLAMDCGLKGLVCSPQEVSYLRMAFPLHEQPFLLVPGIRPTGTPTNDQKRVGTPMQAIRDGANMIVVGRPIRDAPDPVQACKDILKEIEGA